MECVREPQLGYSMTGTGLRVDASPFIKWAGGKRRLLSAMTPFFPEFDSVKTYYEPFLGGGAVFFHLQPPRAVLADTNYELIEAYSIVKDNVTALIDALQSGYKNEEEFYYVVRAKNPERLDPIERVARFIFLNKTCYNGLYRVNQNGQFNVPFGSYRNPTICDGEGLLAASMALEEAQLLCCDFEKAVERAEKGDVIYFDPPYHPLNTTSSFTSYTSEGFSEEDQIRLARLFQHLDRIGCTVMLSNSDTDLIRDLFSNYQIHEIKAARSINSRGDRRGKITELFITNSMVEENE